jgi:hypothetical protein
MLLISRYHDLFSPAHDGRLKDQDLSSASDTKVNPLYLLNIIEKLLKKAN